MSWSYDEVRIRQEQLLRTAMYGQPRVSASRPKRNRIFDLARRFPNMLVCRLQRRRPIQNNCARA